MLRPSDPVNQVFSRLADHYSAFQHIPATMSLPVIDFGQCLPLSFFADFRDGVDGMFIGFCLEFFLYGK